MTAMACVRGIRGIWAVRRDGFRFDARNPELDVCCVLEELEAAARHTHIFSSCMRPSTTRRNIASECECEMHGLYNMFSESCTTQNFSSICLAGYMTWSTWKGRRSRRQSAFSDIRSLFSSWSELLRQQSEIWLVWVVEAKSVFDVHLRLFFQAQRHVLP